MFQMIMGVIFLGLLGTFLSQGVSFLSFEKKHIPTTSLKEYDSVKHRYQFSTAQDIENSYDTATLSFDVSEKEAVQKAMIRTCNLVYQKGVYAKCPNANKVSKTWSFATSIASNGAVDNLYHTGSESSSFSCGNEAAYGRYVLRRTLPIDVAQKYNYRLSGISDTDPGGGIRVYPCGYSEIAFKKNF